MKNGWVLFIVFAVLFGAFAIQNATQLSFRLILWDVKMPPSLLILIAFFTGILWFALLLLPILRRKKREIRLLKKEIEGLKANISTDNNHPLGPEMGDDNFKSFFS
jgi:uncharacterized integral membrane protein